MLLCGNDQQRRLSARGNDLAARERGNVLELLTACCAARLDGSAAPSLLPATAELAAA